MKKHKFNIFPEMVQDDYSRLKNDLTNNGFDPKTPIYLYEGEILDGWNRYRACEELDILPEYVDFEGNDTEAINFVMRTNKRRNLTSWQWACIAVEAEEIVSLIKAESKRRMEIGRPKEGVENFPRVNSKSSEVIADIFNTNEKYVREAEKLKNKDIELFKKSYSGETSYPEVKQTEKKEKLEEKKQAYSKKVESLKTEDAEFKVDIFNTDKKFRIIYADPPWQYDLEQTSPNLGGAIKHYNSMSIDELCNLPVADILEKDAVLFLWITSPKLNLFLSLMNAWGFEYKTSFVWDKVKHNMGHYNSVRHEFLLIGGKGKSAPDVKKLHDSVISIERSETHSEKPVEFMNIIDELYSYGDRIELFCRKPKKGNWYYWGMKYEPLH